jgi:hypothetical protein
MNPQTGERMQCIYTLNVEGAGTGRVYSSCGNEVQGLNTAEPIEAAVGAIGGEFLGFGFGKVLSVLGLVARETSILKPVVRDTVEMVDPVTGEIWAESGGKVLKVINGELVDPETLTIPSTVRPRGDHPRAGRGRAESPATGQR